jgi:hypothetical protein
MGEPTVTLLPIDVASLRAMFPDWRIIEGRRALFAIRQHIEAGCSRRLAAVARPVLTANAPIDLAIQLAALEHPLGIAPTS